MKNHSKNGWMLIEIVFVLAIVIIVVGNFFLLNTISKENNSVSGNLAKGTQLVQERVKIMLNIEEKKTEKVFVIDGQYYSWSDLFDKSITFSPCADVLNPLSNCSDFVLTKCPAEMIPSLIYCIVRDSNNKNADIAAFSQKIRITNSGNNAKNVTVLIWWSDSLGLHKSAITRILTK